MRDASNPSPVTARGPAAPAAAEHRQLVRRLRTGCWVTLLGLAAFAVADLSVTHPNARLLPAVKVVQVLLLMAVICILRRRDTARRVREVGLLAYAGLVVTTAAAGILVDDTVTTPLVITVLAVTSSIVLPWGTGTQVWAVAIAVAAILADLIAVGVGLTSVFPYPGIAVVAALGVSVYVARELQRYRATIGKRDHELRDRARHQDAVVRAVPVTLYSARIAGDDSGRIWVSDHVAQLTGFRPERFAASDGLSFWASRVHPDDQAAFVAAFDDLEDKPVVAVEYRHRCADGSYKWLLSQSVLVTDDAGDCREVLGSWLDITERKRAEADLREKETRYRLVSLATNDAIWDWDLTTNAVVWNEALQTHFGYAPDQVGGDVAWWTEQIHPDDRVRVLRSIDAVIDGGWQSWADEYRYRRADGSYAIVADRGYVVREVSGRAIRMIGAMTDITARKEAEAALQRSETLFRSLIEKASDLISIISPDGTIRYASPSHEQVLGYAPAAIAGRHLLEFLHGEDLEALGEAFAGGQDPAHLPIVMRFRHGDGSWRILEARVTLLENDPVIAGIVVHSRDVTDRMRAQAELERAKDAAEAASRAKSEFVANISHEIRTPMNGILGMTELALDTHLTGEQREYLETVRSSGQWLLTLLNDVLDFSKIEAGKVELKAEEFAVRFTLDETVKLLAPRAAGKGLRLMSRPASGVPEWVIGDADRLRQVLLNLVGNAIKFTEHGEVVVEVERASDDRRATDDAVWLHFAVRDSGIGIPVEKQEAIFNAFEQADGSATRRYGGTGLGLAIAKRLVAMMGGRIWVESTPGEGSTFHCTAAFRAAEAATAARLDASLRAHRRAVPARPPHRRLRVLLAEDNVVNQRVAARMLEKSGHTVTVARDGREAVAAEAGHGFDLVLMDVQMPGMDGLEATAAIRRREQDTGRHVPIIAMTAHAMKGDAERCLAAGMDGYVSKPVNRDRLFELIDALLPPAPVEAADGEVSAAIAPAPASTAPSPRTCAGRG